ncbi:MAG: YajD family HNH nuclease [Desulfurivibrionaceae bacterium]|jgi:5-methylcytosine-specific restriction endonuclease McrA
MTPPTKPDMLSDAQREREKRAQTYREKALKIYPWVCGRCGREFSGKALRDLTVHHKDHNHENNPPDGSNWELLCIYCHDNEHDRQSVADSYAALKPGEKPEAIATSNPFAALGALLKDKK